MGLDLKVSVFTKTDKNGLAGAMAIREAIGGPCQIDLVIMSHECWMKSGIQ